MTLPLILLMALITVVLILSTDPWNKLSRPGYYGTDTSTPAQPSGNIYSNAVSGGVGNGADTSEDTLDSFLLPAGVLSAPGKSVLITAWGTMASNNDAKRAQISFGATVIADTGATNQNGGPWWLEGLVIRSSGGAGSKQQVATGQAILNTTHLGLNAVTLPVEDESKAITIKVTGASTGSGVANDVVVQGFQVFVMN
jgi:hypothetical protein